MFPFLKGHIGAVGGFGEGFHDQVMGQLPRAPESSKNPLEIQEAFNICQEKIKNKYFMAMIYKDDVIRWCFFCHIMEQP